MKKLVNESLQDFLLEDEEEENAVEETEFTPEQKQDIEAFISTYKGDFEDDDLHAFAEELGLNVHEVEEYIYNMAREETHEEEEPIEEVSAEESEEGEEEITSDVKGFQDNIQEDTLENENFRKVLYTGKNMQLVLMTLQPGENIGMEHHDADQFFRFEGGVGQCVINGNEYDVKDGDSVFVPGGAEHDVINTSDEELLQLYTLYGPPNHVDGTIHETKEEADEAEKTGEDKPDGVTTEKLVFESLDEFIEANKLNEGKKDPKAHVRNRGHVVFPAGSKSVKDDKDHFPINSEAQARNALARANQYSSAPEWYTGSVSSLVKRVSSAVHGKYPGIKQTKASSTPGKG
jgi:mannose-6-phosphate isomerase-like protein (cupin superfamily)